MPSRCWRLGADLMPATPEEVAVCMGYWSGHERWGRPVMQWTATRFQREYYAAVETLGMDPVTAYATAWRALYGPTNPNEETTDADA